ncbi:hypothetical protein C8R45DRAFT_925487 [Mycena sanguinolenta]|nr:hypothetical protein C8R45DRAFT_925487 [Mycena sanguinolenta]
MAHIFSQKVAILKSGIALLTVIPMRRTTRARTGCPSNTINFGISRRYDPAEGPWPPLEPAIRGRDKSLPEYSKTWECDPFPTDIYFLGNLIRRHFLDVTVIPRPDDPTQRPTIDLVVTRFAEIQKGLSSWKLRSRIIGKHEFPYLLHRVVAHWYRRFQAVVFHISVLPVPAE